MTDAELTSLVKPIVDQHLGGTGLDTVELRSGEDHDGEASLFLTLTLGKNAVLPASDALQAVTGAVSRNLVAAGEQRFVHLGFRFPDDAGSREKLRSQLRDLMRA